VCIMKDTNIFRVFLINYNSILKVTIVIYKLFTNS
jgi:hypothetical protein